MSDDELIPDCFSESFVAAPSPPCRGGSGRSRGHTTTPQDGPTPKKAKTFDGTLSCSPIQDSPLASQVPRAVKLEQSASGVFENDVAEGRVSMVLQWHDRFVDALPQHKLKVMYFWFSHRLWMFTEFTGIGTCEYWMQSLAIALAKRLDMPVVLPVHVEACDTNKKLQKVMQSGEGPFRVQHCCQSVQHHLKPSALKALNAIQWCDPEYMDLLNQQQQDAHLNDQIKEVKQICQPSAFIGAHYKCSFSNKLVPTQDVPACVLAGETGDGPYHGMRTNGSGITCLDFSQYGLCRKMQGPHGKVIVTWT